MKLRPDGITRRCDVTLDTPAETAIRAAIAAVEAAGCHTLLTDAVILLGEAKDKVSDFVELDEAPAPVPKPVRVVAHTNRVLTTEEAAAELDAMMEGPALKRQVAALRQQLATHAEAIATLRMALAAVQAHKPTEAAVILDAAAIRNREDRP